MFLDECHFVAARIQLGQVATVGSVDVIQFHHSSWMKLEGLRCSLRGRCKARDADHEGRSARVGIY